MPLMPLRRASMGPQLYRCGNKSSSDRVMSVLPLLQWGRNFIVAETRVNSVDTNLNTQLQWGRNFIVAETAPAPMSCFVRFGLQWGRNFIVAETYTPTFDPFNAYAASMGPQLYRCGNPCQARPLPPQPYHRFNGAATLSLRKLSCGPNQLRLFRCFNGAATLSLRKLAEGKDSMYFPFEASMGPQLYRCGNAASSTSYCNWHTSFNGAATLSLRKHANHKGARRSCHRFNGAVTLSLRKRWNCV